MTFGAIEVNDKNSFRYNLESAYFYAELLKKLLEKDEEAFYKKENDIKTLVELIFEHLKYTDKTIVKLYDGEKFVWR